MVWTTWDEVCGTEKRMAELLASLHPEIVTFAVLAALATMERRACTTVTATIVVAGAPTVIDEVASRTTSSMHTLAVRSVEPSLTLSAIRRTGQTAPNRQKAAPCRTTKSAWLRNGIDIQRAARNGPLPVPRLCSRIHASSALRWGHVCLSPRNWKRAGFVCDAFVVEYSSDVLRSIHNTCPCQFYFFG